jgi:hypothetical protein
MTKGGGFSCSVRGLLRCLHMKPCRRLLSTPIFAPCYIKTYENRCVYHPSPSVRGGTMARNDGWGAMTGLGWTKIDYENERTHRLRARVRARARLGKRETGGVVASTPSVLGRSFEDSQQEAEELALEPAAEGASCACALLCQPPVHPAEYVSQRAGYSLERTFFSFSWKRRWSG